MIYISDMREKIWQYCSGRQCKCCKLHTLCSSSNHFPTDISIVEAYDQLMFYERTMSYKQNSDIKITPDELQAFLNGGK